jgi:hypothetical protein
MNPKAENKRHAFRGMRSQDWRSLYFDLGAGWQVAKKKIRQSSKYGRSRAPIPGVAQRMPHDSSAAWQNLLHATLALKL